MNLNFCANMAGFCRDNQVNLTKKYEHEKVLSLTADQFLTLISMCTMCMGCPLLRHPHVQSCVRDLPIKMQTKIKIYVMCRFLLAVKP